MSAGAGPNSCEVILVAPGERWVNVWAKATAHLQAGTMLLFVVDPDRRTAMLCRPDVPPVVFGPDRFEDFRAAVRSALE